MKNLLKNFAGNLIRNIHGKLAYKNILILGDSHVEVFRNYRFLIHFPYASFDIVSVGGATASGLENPRSKTQALNIFNQAIESRSFEKAIVMLGEVDTGFVIWYRAQKYNTPIDLMFDKAVDNYIKLIEKINRKSPVIVISTPLPTIDDQSVGEVAHARKDVKASQKERTDLTLKFNESIKSFCRMNNIPYIDLDRHSLGENGLVDPYLKNPNPLDHHYDPDKYAPLIIKHLKPYL